MTDNVPFWKAKTMQEMTRKEWESLCDGCAKCCLVKLEDEDTGALAFTDIACDLLDCETCACGDYANRSVRVPDCVTLTPTNVEQLYWMPATCAYKLIAEGEDLPWWHPLVSGDQESVHQAGISARGRVIHESTIPEEEWENRIVHWPAVGFEGYYEPEEHNNPDTDEKDNAIPIAQELIKNK